ncbi:MAG: polysaccharide deacetylase family protein [Hyphomicrobiaceae bacterium]|nr:polysaccharide deacetylase family protein [Hyphomicrobiaceae bacterium]
MRDSRYRSLAAALAGLALVAGAGSPAVAEPGRSLLARCFSPAEIAARAGEEKPLKGQHGFDRAEPGRALHPFEPVAASQRGAIRSVRLPAGQKLIALTLDLCEQPGEIAGYDGAIFDYLRAEGVKATLFVGGKWMRSHTPRLRQLMSDPLFEIANHSAGHRNLRLLSGDRLKEEIAAPQRAYESIREAFTGEQCVGGAGAAAQSIPNRMRLFRFPYGACNAQSLDAVNDAGLLAIQWNVSTGDPWPGQSAKAIARAALAEARPGAIVIAHANGRGFHTAEALPLFIPKLKAEGYRFVTVSELLAAGTPEIVNSCYNVKPGDTDRYDNLVAALARPAATRARPGTQGSTTPGGGGSGWSPTVKPQATTPARSRARS